MRLLRPRSHAPLPARRGHAEPTHTSLAAVPTAPGPAAPVHAAADAAAPNPALRAERRMRAAGGPEDYATYACRCGAVFPATPTTSVSCPLCGVHQAW